MNRLTRRAALVGASALPFAAAGAARAQAKFPDRPIRLIIPWAAGGPADAGFRILAQSVSKKLGQQVVVDNKAGASGIMGAMALQEAKPDGYTISQMHMSVLRQPLLNKQLTYNPINDLTYILQITGFVMGVVVRADAPWKTLPELLAYAKANPGKLNWGTLGIGSTQHLAMERVGIAQGGSAGRTRLIAARPTRCAPCWAARSTSPRRPRAGRRWSRPGSCGCWPSSPPSAPSASPTCRR